MSQLTFAVAQPTAPVATPVAARTGRTQQRGVSQGLGKSSLAPLCAAGIGLASLRKAHRSSVAWAEGQGDGSGPVEASGSQWKRSLCNVKRIATPLIHVSFKLGWG